MKTHVFGPVPSRRLGRSLGVDIIPFKTCSYDCIYCQLGRTTEKTVCRREWAPLDDVLTELKDKLPAQPDYVTLSGSGEPTLHSRLGEAVERIKAMTDIPLAVLTNGSLLWDEDVRAALMPADLVVPSLDAGSPAVFEAMNRPHEQVTFERMVDGLASFSGAFRGECRLEVFLVDGVNASPAAVADIATIARRVRPDRIELNTVARPPAEECAAVDANRMRRFAAMFDPPAEVISAFRGIHQQPAFTSGREAVLAMLRRRPCSLDDIAGGLAMHRNEAVKHVEELMEQHRITATRIGTVLFYRAADQE